MAIAKAGWRFIHIEESLVIEFPSSPNDSLRKRIARAIAGSDWPQPVQSSTTTTDGATEQTLEQLAYSFWTTSTRRLDIYEDVEKMDATVDEVATALDILADNSVSPDGGASLPFTIAYTKPVDMEIQSVIQGVLARTQWYDKTYEIARAMLLYGDEFRQFVIDDDLQIVRLMHMPPASMVRNEDQFGLLKMGRIKGEWAFEQYVPKTDTFIAGFAPWQILHFRWNASGSSAYGRSLLLTARTAWRKLQAMEEALVINWITRAFARLLFYLDVTGKSEKEAEQAIRQFKASLQTRQITKDVQGLDQLSVVKDIFIGRSYHEMGGRAEQSLTDAKVLDTSSTGYQQIQPIEYYRSKILMAMRVPRAYLGLEENINAKATLTQEDRRYQRFLRRIQAVLTQGIKQTINLQLALYHVDPLSVPYIITWWTPSWSDIAEDSTAMKNYAVADLAYRDMKVIDRKWMATRHLRMSDVEWEQMIERVQKEQSERAEEEPEEGPSSEMKETPLTTQEKN